MASKTAHCMNLRLLVHQKSRKILYAEAGKDFVDLLFSFLVLPTASVIKLLSALNRAKNIGCLPNLYKSVEELQSVLLNTEKSHLLEPKVMFAHFNDVLRIESAPMVYYVCGEHGWIPGGASLSHKATTRSGGTCPCGKKMSYSVQLKKPSMGNSSNSAVISGVGSSGGGYVKETATFTITDDLEISPSSAIANVNLLSKLNVDDLSDLVERNASVGSNEALELLWASLVSSTPLNDVFGAAVSTSK